MTESKSGDVVDEKLDQLKAALSDRYAVEREIGQGGMATVYLASDLKHHRKVAVKVVKAELAASLGADRFLREIDIAAGLNHPHILPLYDSGDADGLLYYVMPFVEGESLRDRLDREKQLPINDALRIAREAADGLAYANSHGVIHRDIKPENILLSGGHAVIADFGIARALSASGGERLTGTGLSVGTPIYMSPEQASGDRQLDGRSDLYSLACVLYEMLAGEPPFTGRTLASIVHQHVLADPPSVAVMRPSVPAQIASSIQTAMAKAPADRYPTAKDFADQLGPSTDLHSGQATQLSGSGLLEGMPLLKNLFERRVPHIVALYVLMTAVVVLFTDFLVDRFVLSPFLPDFALVALASMIPAVVLVSYFHGKPGPSTLTRAERIGVPTNVGVSALVLFLNFNVMDLGAATTTITVEDEDGQRVERTVPKSAFRKRLALFNFDNTAGDRARDWLGLGIPIALDTDLDQDLFVDAQSSVNFVEQLAQTDYPDGVGLPFTLKRQIANDRHLPYFVSGSYTVEDGQYVVTASLFETRRGRLLQERTFAGDDLFALVDEMAVQLKHDLEIPEQYIEDVEDLPIGSILTNSMTAFEAMANGLHALIVREEWEVAARHLERAVAQDPTFATAHYALYRIYLLGNQSAKAQLALQASMEHRYKLAEKDRYTLKISHYEFRQQPDKVLAVAKMRVELFPDDIDGRLQLAQLYVFHNDVDATIAQFEQILKIDPGQYNHLQTLGKLYQQRGEFDRALDYLEQYAKQFPNNEESFNAIGDVYENLGRHADAKAQYDRALLLKTDDVGTLVRLADIERDLGRFDEALGLLDEARAAAKTPVDRASVYAAFASFSEWKGQLESALEFRQLEAAENRQFLPTVVGLREQVISLDRYVKAGQTDRAFRILRGIEAQLTPPWDMLLPHIAYMAIYTELEAADSAEAAIAGVERIIRASGVEALRSRIVHTQGRIHEFRNQFEEAIAQYERELELAPTNFRTHTDIGRAYRRVGRYEEAEGHIQMTLRVHPFDPIAHYELALVYADAEDDAKALEHLETALRVWEEADPAYQPALRARTKFTELGGATGMR